MTSVVRPLPWQSGSSIFSQAPSSFSGRMAESRQGSTLRHDVEPTKIGRRRVLALTNLILVVRCASHLLLSVLFAYIRQRVRGEQHILRGEAHSYQDNVLRDCMRHRICGKRSHAIACDRMRSHAIAAIAAIANLKKLY